MRSTTKARLKLCEAASSPSREGVWVHLLGSKGPVFIPASRLEEARACEATLLRLEKLLTRALSSGAPLKLSAVDPGACS